MDVVYDNWGYSAQRYGTGVVNDVELEYFEKITHTINAQGTTTYTVDFDEEWRGSIKFGHLFESDFMTGTEKIHHIKQWYPKGYITDTNEEYEKPAFVYRDIFTGFPNFRNMSGGLLELYPFYFSWHYNRLLERVGPAPDDE